MVTGTISANRGISWIGVIIALAVIAGFIKFLSSGDPETERQADNPAPAVTKKMQQDMLEQVQKKQADAMLEAVKKADPRFRDTPAIDPVLQRQLEEAKKYQYQQNF